MKTNLDQVYFYAMWGGIDITGKLTKCSCSKLARNGDLDPTIFNPSKRIAEYDKQHWLTFNTLIATLNGANMTLVEYSVIFQILCEYPNFDKMDKIQEIVTDMNNRMQYHITSLGNAQQTNA